MIFKFFIKTANWKITAVDYGYLIKNVQFQEYLYAAANVHAFDQERRSIFTWKDYETLGDEGIWNFNYKL